MKIGSLQVEIVRVTPAVAEFLVRVQLDEPAANCEVAGRVTGPKCPGISTVEVVYPLKEIESSGCTVSLGGAVPEPNLWKPETPFTYAVVVDLRVDGSIADSRSGIVALRARRIV